MGGAGVGGRGKVALNAFSIFSDMACGDRPLSCTPRSLTRLPGWRRATSAACAKSRGARTKIVGPKPNFSLPQGRWVRNAWIERKPSRYSSRSKARSRTLDVADRLRVPLPAARRRDTSGIQCRSNLPQPRCTGLPIFVVRRTDEQVRPLPGGLTRLSSSPAPSRWQLTWPPVSSVADEPIE